MDTNLLLQRLMSRAPLFDSIPDVAFKRICGLESEYGCIDFTYIPGEFLSNGGLIYSDCSNGHPEYCTPEVSNPLSAVLYCEAGKVICQNRKFASRLYCNNNDWDNVKANIRGTTYGAHESYATRVPRDKWFRLIPFLIARTVMCGAGWINDENQFEISQRAKFIMWPLHLNTQDNRAIINLRNEPLMNLPGYHRLHLICGDANMNPVATFLKVGTTSLVLEMQEMGALPEVRYNQSMTSRDIKGISKKTSDWYLGGARRGRKELLSILNLYYEQARSLFSKRDIITDLILITWKDTLEKLGRNPMELGFRLDWVTKLILLEKFCRQEDRWTWQWLRSLDMEYHNLDRQEGLFYLLEKQGQTEQLFTPELIKMATVEPPPDTRAYVRGKVVQHLAQRGRQTSVVAGNWDTLSVKSQFGLLPFYSRTIANPFYTYEGILKDFKDRYK